MDLYNIRQKLNLGIPITNIPLRVTYYSRVSTDHKEQLNSLNNQISHFEEYINNNPHWTYIDGYIDEGISGTTDYKRENFMKMISDAKNNTFDLIITKEISRFSRNTLDSIHYTRELLSYGVAVLFINDNINTALPDAELRLTIMASMAQDEIRRLSERVKFGMHQSIKKGTILGNNMLYGYKKDKQSGNLIIIPSEANVVRRLFTLYAIDNYSLNQIAKLFNNENIKTNQDKPWTVKTLSRMIDNPKYKGYYCANKSEIIDYMTKKIRIIPKTSWILYKDNQKIPPIIEEKLWLRANKRLNERSKSKTITYNKYPLSSKIICKHDHSIFHHRKTNNEIIWTCSKYLTEGKRGCNSPHLKETEIYQIISDIINILNMDLSKIITILASLYKTHNLTPNINKYLNDISITNKLIILLINKIIVSHNQNNTITLEIYLNSNHQNLDKTYQFKRGYNTNKRYLITYQVSLYFLNSKSLS